MTVRISGLAVLAAGSAGVIARLGDGGKGTRARGLPWIASCYAAALGMIAFALSVAGQLLLWACAAAGWPR